MAETMRRNKQNDSVLFMPLYIYPVSESTWQPLYSALSKHPNTNFCIIVNPNSGPGGIPLPSDDYQREVPRLNAYVNATTIGYVKIDYCKRPLPEVLEEISAYANWPARSGDSALHVQGIFVDETPNHYTEERAQYLEAVRRFVKTQSGLLGDRLVIENPGTPPEGGLDGAELDVCFTCEEPYARWCSEEIQTHHARNPWQRSRTGYMVSGIPKAEVYDVVRTLKKKAMYVFATDLHDDFYEQFGPSWEDFVTAFDD